MMKNLPASPVFHATFQSCVVIANKYSMCKHVKLLYAASALLLIIIIMIYWSGKLLTCRTGSDAHGIVSAVLNLPAVLNHVVRLFLLRIFTYMQL